MPKPKSTAKLVITSVIISVIVIAIFALVFLNYIVPAYQITEDQIYSILIKLFPIVIGLVLIQIGVAIGTRHDANYRDQVDKLPPNAYTKPFECDAKDDPSNTTPAPETIIKEVIKEVPVEVVKEVEKEVPVIKEIIREVPVEIVKEIIREVPVGDGKEIVKEVPVIKEVIKEIPIEIIKEVPVETERIVERIVEKPVPVASDVAPSQAESVMLDFEGVLKEECEMAKRGSYDITLALLKGGSLSEEKLLKLFGDYAFVFQHEGDYALIFDFANESEVSSIITRWEAELGGAKFSIASQNGQAVDPERLKKAAAAGF